MSQKKSAKAKAVNESLPVGGEADVVVIGSGPAGIGASLAASRKGVKVILIEKFPFLGGMSTLVPVSTWPLNTGVEAGELDLPYDGIAGEIRDRLEKLNALELHTTLNDGFDHIFPLPGERLVTTKWYYFEPEVLKYLYFDMLHEAKVTVMVNSFVVDTVVKDNKIEAVVVETLTRRELIKGKIFIDTTGSADVVSRSGAPAVLGSGEDDGVPAGLIMPAITTFRIAGVDTDGLDMYEVARIYEEHRSKGEIDVPLRGLFWQIVCKGVVQIFGTHVNDINPLDPHRAAFGEMEQRRQIRDITGFLKKEIPAFRDCRVINTGVCMGMIGTRRIRGDYFMTQQDIIEARKFEDGIAVSNFRIEVWDPGEPNARFHHVTGTWYTIPYRCLLPKELENVIVGGSCLSGQYIAMAGWAMMPVCFKTGQAAGTAASLCIIENTLPRGISVTELQSILRQDGVFLG